MYCKHLKLGVMKTFLMDKLIRENQEKLELLIKSNIISIKIKERLSAKNYKSIIALIEEKAEMIQEIDAMDKSICEGVNSLKKFGEFSQLHKRCNESEREKLKILKEISFRVLKQMETNKLYDENLVKELFDLFQDDRYSKIFLA